MSSNTFIEGILVKVKWLVANVTTIGSLGGPKRTILGGVLAGSVFTRYRTYLWSGGHFVV